MNEKVTILFLLFVFASLYLVKAHSIPRYYYKRPTAIGTKTEQPDIDLPKNITIPSGRKFKFELFAHGYQIYQCSVENKTWTLVTPDAYVINDKRTQTFTRNYYVSHHYFVKDPINGGRATWESILKGDDSKVVTKPIASNDSPDPKKNIPWLVTQTTANYGHGAFQDVTNVLRINTVGGVAPPVEDCGKHYQDKSLYHSEYFTDYWVYH